MEINIKKWFLRQKDGLKIMEKLGRITQLSISGTIVSPCFEFSLKQQNDFSGEDTSDIDFSKYRVRIKLTPGNQPMVSMIRGLEPGKPPHTYPNWNLCMYHPSEMIWSDSGSLGADILPLIYTWSYFYEVWKVTGVWYGREYKH